MAKDPLSAVATATAKSTPTPLPEEPLAAGAGTAGETTPVNAPTPPNGGVPNEGGTTPEPIAPPPLVPHVRYRITKGAERVPLGGGLTRVNVGKVVDEGYINAYGAILKAVGAEWAEEV